MSDSIIKIKTSDRVFWVLAILLGALIAFTLLRRDAEKQFGAVSYGAFPKFSLKTVKGDVFDDHTMKGQVWAVHQMDGSPAGKIAVSRIADVARRTWTDKRHIYIFSLLNPTAPPVEPLVSSHFLVPDAQSPQSSLAKSAGVEDPQKILLIDQNGVVRGIYSASSPDSMRRFSEDVLRLL